MATNLSKTKEMKASSLLQALLLLSLLLATWLWGYSGILLSDEYLYAEQMVHLAKGTFELTPSAFSNRFGLLAPGAFLSYLFNYQDFAFILWPFICLIILIIAIRFYQSIVPFFPLVLLITSNPSINGYATDVSHDWVMTVYQTIAILLLANYLQKPSAPTVHGLLIVLCLAIGFLSKVSIVFVVPFFLWLAWRYQAWSEHRQISLSILIFGGLFCLLFLGTYYGLTGDALFRWHGIQGEHNISEWGYYGKDWKRLVARATVHIPAFLLSEPSLGIPVFSGLFLAFWPEKSNGIFLYFRIYFLILLILFCWGSSSLSFYNPMVLVDRMWLSLIPAGFFLGVSFEHWPAVLRSRFFYLFAFTLGVMAMVAWFLFSERMPHAIWTGSFFILLSSFYYFTALRSTSILYLSVLCVQVIFSLSLWLRQHPAPLLSEYQLMNQLNKSGSPVLIYTDSLMVRMPGVHLNWAEDTAIELEVWDKAIFPFPTDKAVYLWQNTRRTQVMQDYYHRPLPAALEDVPKVPVYNDKQLRVWKLRTMNE